MYKDNNNNIMDNNKEEVLVDILENKDHNNNIIIIEEIMYIKIEKVLAVVIAILCDYFYVYFFNYI